MEGVGSNNKTIKETPAKYTQKEGVDKRTQLVLFVEGIKVNPTSNGNLWKVTDQLSNFDTAYPHTPHSWHRQLSI